MQADDTLSETGSPLGDESRPVVLRRPARRGVRVGRYLLLGELGAGAGGTVYTAWDPQLDRKVALRLVVLRDDEAAGERERLLRAARALAKLSHPNVVTIHDAGEQGEQVWIAMEHLTGPTLDAWARARRMPERVRVLTDVARGVAAAHAAGLVHRGLEPAHVTIGDDGRVRVTGFALAPGRVPADDQPGWSALARALLHGEGPFEGAGSGRARVAGWLRRIVERAGASEPSQRWPSMAALVEALERGRARARVRTVAAVLVGVVALGLGVAGQRRWELARRSAACEVAGAAIDAVWNDEARQRLRDAFAATGVSFAATTADKVMPWLDERAAAWAQARTEVCMGAEVHGTWSEDALDRAVWCLEEQQLSMASLVEELGRADATAVQKAVSAVSSPSMSMACTDAELLLRQPAPPTQGRAAIREVREVLSRARSLSLAGHYGAALEVAGQARERAEGLEWPPLWAAARALEADLLERTGSLDAAGEASAEAFVEAGRTGEWKVAADAALLASWIEARQARASAGRVWAEHAALAIARAGDPNRLQETTRLQSLGNGHRAVGEHEQARALHEQALAILEEVLGPHHPHVASCLNNLATTHADAGDHAAAQGLYERALAIREQALGPEHPDVAGSLSNLGMIRATVGDQAAAQRLFERALAIRERALGPDHLDVANSLTGLANVHGMAERYEQARALHERALAIRERALGPEHPDVAASLNNVALTYAGLGRHAEARPLFERAVGIWEAVLGLEHPVVISVLDSLAEVHEVMGATAEAEAVRARMRARQAGAE